MISDSASDKDARLMTTARSLTAGETPIARMLAEFAWALEPSALPDELRRKATHHITDAIGLAFASHHFPFAAPALRGFEAAGSRGDATVIGASLTLAPRALVDASEQATNAVPFYEARGFVRIGRSELDEQGRPYPLIHFRYGGGGSQG